MTSFMEGEIARTFSGAKAATLTTRLQQGLRQSTNTSCHSPNPKVAEGPPGPILDRLVIEHVSVSGRTATVRGEVHVTDWQGGVSHVPTADGGRRVNWATVPGLLDATYQLRRAQDGQWLVTSFSAAFAPGHNP
jgi:hypothetical protein